MRMTDSIHTWSAFIAWPAIGIVLWAVVYHLLPSVICQVNSRLASAFRPRQPALDYSWLRYLPVSWADYLDKRLFAAGFRDRQCVAIYLLVMIAPVIVLTLLAAILRGPIHLLFLTGILVAVSANSWVSFRIRKRQQAFQVCLYKIYRFIDLQLTSGVKCFDVLKGLPEAIDQPRIVEDFLRFSACLALTLDLDRALEELQLSFAGPEMNLLASQLRNCMQTGVSGQTFQRMENLLFNRHLILVRARSKKLRSELLIAALLALVPIEILFVYPLAAQALASLGQLYGP